MTKVWPVQDAKSRFSELLETSVKDGPQIVSRRGIEMAVLVPIDQWRQLQRRARPDLKSLLLADKPITDELVPQRGRIAYRVAPPFE